VARKKKWLKPDTPAYIALEEVVLNKKASKGYLEAYRVLPHRRG